MVIPSSVHYPVCFCFGGLSDFVTHQMDSCTRISCRAVSMASMSHSYEPSPFDPHSLTPRLSLFNQAISHSFVCFQLHLPLFFFSPILLTHIFIRTISAISQLIRMACVLTAHKFSSLIITLCDPKIYYFFYHPKIPSLVQFVFIPSFFSYLFCWFIVQPEQIYYLLFLYALERHQISQTYPIIFVKNDSIRQYRSFLSLKIFCEEVFFSYYPQQVYSQPFWHLLSVYKGHNHSVFFSYIPYMSSFYYPQQFQDHFFYQYIQIGFTSYFNLLHFLLFFLVFYLLINRIHLPIEFTQDIKAIHLGPLQNQRKPYYSSLIFLFIMYRPLHFNNFSRAYVQLSEIILYKLLKISLMEDELCTQHCNMDMISLAIMILYAHCFSISKIITKLFNFDYNFQAIYSINLCFLGLTSELNFVSSFLKLYHQQSYVNSHESKHDHIHQYHFYFQYDLCGQIIFQPEYSKLYQDLQYPHHPYTQRFFGLYFRYHNQTDFYWPSMKQKQQVSIHPCCHMCFYNQLQNLQQKLPSSEHCLKDLQLSYFENFASSLDPRKVCQFDIQY